MNKSYFPKVTKNLSFFLLFFLCCIIKTSGQGASSYQFSASTGTFTPLVGGTLVPIVLDDDLQSSSIPIGFTFNFGGTTYTNLIAGSNGYLSLGTGATSATATQMRTNSFVTANPVIPIIAPIWDDLDGTASLISGGTPQASYIVTGSIGNQVFTFEWLNFVAYTGSTAAAEISFQVKLYEVNGNIEFVYRKEAGTGVPSGASIGIGSTAGDYLSLNNSGALPTASSTVNTTSISSYPATGQIYTFMPPPPCVIPADQPTSFLSTPTNTAVAGSFTAALSNPTKYLVVRTPGTAPLNTNPVNGAAYSVGGSLGNGTIAAVTSTSSFNSIGLIPGTQYTYTIFSFNDACATSTAYNTTLPLIGTATTVACPNSISGSKNIPGDYPTITAAMADLNLLGISSAVNLELGPTYTSAGETFPINISNTAACLQTSSVNTVTIRPASGVASMLSITSADPTSTVILNGINNFIIDGRPGGSGTASYLTIANTNLGSSSAMQFMNDASNNIVRYCTVQSVENSTTNGTIAFLGGLVTGNDDNTIDNCTILDGATTPVTAIYSNGTSAAIDNSNNTISNCNIANYFSATLLTRGIHLTATGNSGWTITNNRLFQTATRIYTSAQIHNGIAVLGGSGYTISGNTIGFADAAGNGTTNMVGNSVALTGTFPSSYTATGSANATRYMAINCAFTAGSAVSEIQGNTIGGFAMYTSNTTGTANGSWCGINVTSGNANIGTTTGNTIGATTGNGSVYVASTATTAGAVVGIYATSANTINIQNNSIGAIDAMGTGLVSTATSLNLFTGIDVAGAGNRTISNNTIGNTTANNIRTGNLTNAGATVLSNVGTNFLQATGACTMVGIRSTSTGNTLSINGNTLRGWATAGTTSAITGIIASGTMTGTTPSISINNNILGTAALGWINYTVANSGALTGISTTNTVATTRTINMNDFRGIVHSVAGTSAHTYINLTGATAANNIANIDGNTFTDLNVNTTGAIAFISHSYAIPSTGQLIINNNSIVTAFNRPSASGSVILTTTATASTAGAINNYTNNNFSNITVAGTTTITGFISSVAGPSKTITGNVFNNWTAITGAVIGMSFVSWNNTSIVSNNTLTNITGQAALTGITIGSTTNSATTFNIASNTINNLTSTGTGGAVTGIVCANTSQGININGNTIHTLSSTGASQTVLGISVTGATSTNVFDNTIRTLSGSGATQPLVRGISVSAGTSVNVYRNKIYDLFESGAIATTAGAVNGMIISGGTTVNVYNNLIGDLRTPAASLTDAIRGINITSSTASSTLNILYNTIYLNTTSTGTNFGSTGIYHTTNATATTAKLVMGNNIIVNNSTPNGTGLTVAYRRSSNTLTNYDPVSNYNLLYAGTPASNRLIFNDGTNSHQTIIAYKYALAPIDQLSVSDNPTFLSTTGSSADFLHIDPLVPSAAESGGLNVAGITDDYDSQIRQGNAGYAGSSTTGPDIGADEFNGTIKDLLPPKAIYTPLANNCNTTTRTLTGVNITDVTGIPLTGSLVPRIYWKVGAGSYTSAAGVNTGGTATNSTWDFTMTGPFNISDVISFYIIAQDNLGNTGATPGIGLVAIDVNTITTHPTSPSTYTVGNTLSGTYLVGASQVSPNFATLTSAISSYNGGCPTGPVVFELTDASYGASETFPLTINANPLASSINTLTIRPQTGVIGNVTITSANTTGTINLDGAKNVVIDGRIGSTGSTSQLQIINTATAGTALRFVNDASNNKITYCDIQGQNTSATSSTASNSGVIYIGGTATAALAGNDKDTIDNCTIHATSGGNPAICISAIGNTTNATSYNDSIRIANCNIYDFYSASVASAGIKADAGNSAWTINNNSVYQTTTKTYTTANTHRGFWITPNTASLTPQASGFIISDNYIGGTAPMAGGTPYTMFGPVANIFNGMDLSVGLGISTSVQNNTVANIDLTSTSTGNVFVGIGQANGNVNIGDIAANTIGSGTGTGSITINNTGSAATSFGIRIGAGTGITANVSNNIIGSILVNSTTTVSNNLVGIAAAGGSGTFTINNNIIGSTTTANSLNLPTASTAAVAQSLTGIFVSSSSTPLTVNVTNNTIANLNNAYASTATSQTRGISFTSTGAIANITGNTIYNLTNSSGSTGSGASAALLGIGMGSTTAGSTVTGNIAHSLSSTHASAAVNVVGMYIGAATTGNNIVSKNFIHSLSAATTSASAYITGMDVGAGLVNVANNMIRLGIDANGNSITTPLSVRGISQGGTLTASNFYFNSIYIGGSGVGSTATNTFAFQKNGTIASGTENIKNNIFYNARSNAFSGGGKHYALYNLTNSTNVSLSNNLYYATGTDGVMGYTGTADAASYTQGWAGGDINSGYGDPQFINPIGNSALVDLHINASNPTPIESMGTTITSVTDDYDGQTRSSLTPTDVGADAGNFIVQDIFPPLISHFPLSVTCGLGNRTLTAVISDATGVPTTGLLVPRVYYQKNAGTWYSQPGILTSGTATNGTWTFTIVASDMGGLFSTDVVGYYIIAQDASTSNNISSSPAGAIATNVNSVTTAPTPNTYNLNGVSLSGTINVGTGGTYTTLTAAVADYNNGCINGPIVFNLTDLTYTSPSETFPITILNNTNANAINTLTIQPATGISPTISGSATAVIRLNGADFVTVDGSNSGTSSQNLTISNSSSSTSSTVIWVNSANANDGAGNNTIKNCIITGNSQTTTLGGIIGSGTAIGGLAEAQNNNNSYINNSLSKSQYGIAVVGSTAVGNDLNLNISNNQIGSAIAANKVLVSGIGLFQQQNAIVANNNINGVAGSSSGTMSGIQLSGTNAGITINNNTISDISQSNTQVASGINIIGTATNCNVLANKISNIKNTNTGGYGANGINLGSVANPADINVFNNIVSDVAGDGYGSAVGFNDNGYGIIISAGGGYNINNNTVLMNTNQPNAGANGGVSAALNIISTVPGPLNILNNVLLNTQTTLTRYSVYCASPASVFNSIDYNLYNSTGPNLSFLGAAVSNISAWRTATGKDKGSVTGNVPFVSATDLHIVGSSADAWNVFGRGIAIPTLSSDFDAQPRSVFVGIPVTIGADEISIPTSIPADAVMTPSTPVIGTPTVFTSAGRKIAEISWTGAVPPTISSKYYPGVQPPATTYNPSIYGYIDIPASPSSGYNYSIKYYYTDAEKNAISDADLSIIKQNGSNPWTFAGGVGSNMVDADGKFVTSNSLTDFSKFSLTGVNPLNIRLGRMSASNIANRNRVDWKTESEMPGDYFELERSSNGQEFHYLNTLVANGVSSSYTYWDETPLLGANFYRLKMFDRSGSHTYSSVVNATVRGKNVVEVQAFPNPFETVLTLKVNGTIGNDASISLTDVAGRTIKTIQVNAAETTIVLAGLAQGIYFVKYRDELHQQTIKISKQ